MQIGYDARLINETGVGRYIQNTLPFLIKNKKNKWVIFVRKQEWPLLEKIVRDKTNVSVILFNHRWHSFSEQLAFIKVLYPLKLDIFFSPYINVPVFYFKKRAVTIHDLTVLTHKTGKASTKGRLGYLIKRLGYRIALNSALRSSIIFTVAQSVKQDIISNFPKIDKEKILVTYNGFTKLNVTKNKKVLNFIQDASPYLFYIGNAHPHKNLEFLVESLNNFFNSYKRVNIVIAGRKDFFMERLLNKIETFNNKNKFYYFENPTNEELGALYKSSKALILPSLKEGFGLQILEAMSFEIPILASKIPVYKEISNNLCVYFDPLSYKSFCYGLAKVLRITKREKESLAKKYHVHISKFSWEKTSETTLKTLENKTFTAKQLKSRNY